jgi:hypothetical protein
LKIAAGLQLLLSDFGDRYEAMKLKETAIKNLLPTDQ